MDKQDAIQRAQAGERVVIRGADGEPLAAIVSLEDLQELQAYEALEDKLDIEACERFEAERAAGRAELVPWEEVKRNLGL